MVTEDKPQSLLGESTLNDVEKCAAQQQYFRLCFTVMTSAANCILELKEAAQPSTKLPTDAFLSK